MGNTAFFISLPIAGAIALVFSKELNRGIVILLTSLIVIDIVIVGAFFGIERVAERMEEVTLESQRRDEYVIYTTDIIEDHLLFGIGAGSYYGVFPKYRTNEFPGLVDHAHNDYIEFASELGLIGFIPLSLFVLVSLWAAIRAQSLRRSQLMRGMAFASVMGISAILIHSTVDFNLQIPANALMFIFLCALAWIALHLDRREGST